MNLELRKSIAQIQTFKMLNQDKHPQKECADVHLIRGFWAAFLCLSVVSCSFVPAMKEDGFSVPIHFKENQAQIPAAESANNSLPHQTVNALNPLKRSSAQEENLQQGGINPKLRALTSPAWWRELEDPALNELQDKLLTSNVSVLQLSTQVRVAQASLKQAEASLFPSLNLNLSASRAANQLSVPKGTSYSLSSPMSWELDVWGRIDALTQVAASNALASELDLKQAKVSVQALLVQTYVTLLASRGQENLLSSTFQVYEKSWALTQARYKAGVVSSADVAQASTQLKSAQAQWQDVVLQRKQIEHALSTLLGLAPSQLKMEEFPSRVEITSNSKKLNIKDFNVLPKVPVLPEVFVLDVLQFRPDIQAAKRRVEAANAQVGVARAAFFPPLVLSASAGYRNTDLASLLSIPNQAWSIGPSLVLPLLDGGLRQAAKEGAQAQLDNAVLNYRQVVLNAFQEIEDNLVALNQLILIESYWLDAQQSALRNLEAVYAQYQAGVVPYLSVVSAQSAYLSAQRSLIDVGSRKLMAWNQLKKNTFVGIEPL